jgi:hypothetical protein
MYAKQITRSPVERQLGNALRPDFQRTGQTLFDIVDTGLTATKAGLGVIPSMFWLKVVDVRGLNFPGDWLWMGSSDHDTLAGPWHTGTVLVL